MTELRECPFCGGKATLNSGYDEGNGYSASSGGWWASVGCPECEIDKLTCEESTEDMAVDTVTSWWNDRYEQKCRYIAESDPYGENVWIECSRCGYQEHEDYAQVFDGYSYCPGCGARIIKENE